jgi:hypothetical protein
MVITMKKHKEKKDKIYLLFYALKYREFIPLMLFKPMILYILIAIFYYFIFIYFADISLCDGEGLEELRTKLASYTAEYEEHHKEYEKYNSLLEQATNRPEKDNGIERYLIIKKESKAIDIACSLRKIRVIEISINNLDPNFISTIKKEWYEYL